jgi:long-chain acyl-CoA synthetase
MRKKRYGIWQAITWTESLEHMRNFALGLMSLGFKRGDKICIIGDNDPEYYWAEIGTHAAGMTSVGMFTDLTPKELLYVVDNCDAVLVVAHDQEQCDKLLEIREQIPNVAKVVYWEERGMWGYDDPWMMSFAAFEAMGQHYGQEHPRAFDESVAAGTPQEYAIFSYTSGTTGLPKAAMITQGNMMYGAMHAASIQPYAAQDDYASFSPLAWIAEQIFGITGHSMWGTTINFPEKPETVQSDTREVAPRGMLLNSRLWESVVSQVQARMADAHPMNQVVYRTFLPIGYKIAEFADQRKQPNLVWRLLYMLGNLVLFAPLRDKLGLSHIKYAYTGGASLSPDVLRFFRALNIELLQLYGSTECQTHTIHYLGDVRLGTVGKPPPGVQIKITEDGEIAVKSRSVFKGYYKAPEKTEEVLRDGWFHTGDAGIIDENGHLVYLDRMSDMIELASGEKFSPQYIEGRIKFNPYVQDVMAVGGFDMPFVSALVTIDFANTARWAEKNGISFTTMLDLTQKPNVRELVRSEIERVNGSLPENSRVRRFVILNRSFDADEAELTRTRKLRRRHLEQRYGDILSAIYAGDPSITIHSEVQYQDGRSATREVDLNISDVGNGSVPSVQTPVAAVAK